MGAFLSKRQRTKSAKSSTLDPNDVTSQVRKTKHAPTRTGGFSDIWEGELDVPVDGGGKKTQHVAIKSLRAVHLGEMSADSPDAHVRLDKRLKREMLVWKPLKHPRIVPCLGYATLDGSPCLVMPWYENGNAKDYITHHPECDRKALVIQVAEGLVYLHSHNPPIVHYDVKSLNVMVNDDGNAMITDFGIAKVIQSVSTGYTTNNASAFTVRCSSPEALEGEDRTVKSDVYSFACFALEIMSGQAPFWELKTSAAVIAAKYAGTMPDPSRHPQLPESDPLWGLMRRCWDSNAAQRPTMSEVLAELGMMR